MNTLTTEPGKDWDEGKEGLRLGDQLGGGCHSSVRSYNRHTQGNDDGNRKEKREARDVLRVELAELGGSLNIGGQEGEKSEDSSCIAESMMAPAEEGSSDGEAVSGVDGEFSSGETDTTFMGRCSGEVWKYGQGQGKRGSRNGHVGIMCVQTMVEVKGVDEIMKENNVEETKGEEEGEGESRRQWQLVW